MVERRLCLASFRKYTARFSGHAVCFHRAWARSAGRCFVVRRSMYGVEENVEFAREVEMSPVPASLARSDCRSQRRQRLYGVWRHRPLMRGRAKTGANVIERLHDPLSAQIVNNLRVAECDLHSAIVNFVERGLG